MRWKATRDQPSVRKLGEWTFEEYGQLMSSRLTALYERESEPKILGRVMEAWGIPAPSSAQADVAAELNHYADQARHTATETRHYLCTPISECEAARLAEGGQPVCSWGIFNPLGPTVAYLYLLPVPERPEWLLFEGTRHPFTPTAIVYGLLPDKVVHDRARLLGVLHELFRRHGNNDERVMPSLPTFFLHLDDALLSSEELKELVFTAAATAQYTEPLDVTTERMLRYRGDPWGRTMEEVKIGVQIVDSGAPEPTTRVAPPSRDMLERWWAAVTDPRHEQAEGTQMLAAEQGALAFARGEYASQPDQAA